MKDGSLSEAERKAKRTRARQPQRRPGEMRFNVLLQALEALLAENSLQDVGLYQIAEKAGVPSASVYHFFPNKDAALIALADIHHKALEAIALEPLVPSPAGWQDIVRRKVTRSAQYHNEHPAALRLFYGAGVSAEIKVADTSQSIRLAQRRAELLNRHFDMPVVPDLLRLLATSIAIVDGVFGLSYSQHGNIAPVYIEEAHRASVAYLRTYLPEILVPRVEPDDG
jgi:AcrR family transcriptional regulator